MQSLEGCDALHSAHMLPEVFERPLSLDNTSHRIPDVHQTIFNIYFKMISLIMFLRQKTLRGSIYYIITQLCMFLYVCVCIYIAYNNNNNNSNKCEHACVYA